ncbi:hypothetical protein GLOTRDRAFT_99932 [Gloeophyllum trabeum ATCC 11539]|uniref:Uncharacterized protein n=1 Tax=Gloeophyllum trabeum (strain ATCC 11539 / FP-39264 / Madison 617) TaxID=670483 RepID=S7Q930_GLOTA|nr:uncharacterized protein GLOTRDRAFT_99932 [Gloeophyllum trabeum ATCC 11539]EPQ55953.1 hypothetical protein GLOTRDRAFT_99932 [Gloeophyllum trabeum ATCC 11539]
MSPGNLSPYYSPIHSRSTRASFASDTGMPPIGADRRSLRSSRSRIASTKDGLHALSRNSLSSSGHGHRSTEEDDSDSEERGGSSVETVTAGPRPGLWRSRSSSDGGHQSGSEHSSRHGHATIELQESQDVEMMDFVDRFRSLVTQITRETEEGMDFAREAGDGTMLRHRVISLDEDNSEDSSSRSDGRSMTPEDYISMLGGYVRRMPTIESLGSREVMSLANSKGGQSGSRPPTRANTLSMSDQGSQPPSRSNSLNWRQLDAVAANNGAGESIGREATPQSHSHSGSGSQRSVVRSASITSRRSILTTSSPVDSPVQIEFPASHEQLEES